MKKIIALVVAILMIASMSVVAFAREEGVVQTAEETVSRVQADATDGEAIGNGTELVYTVSQGYVVTIPDDTVFVNLKANGTISLTNVKVPANKQVQVQIASADWELDDENLASDPVKYGAYLTNVDAYAEGETSGKLANNAVVLSANMDTNLDTQNPLDGAKNSGTIYFATVGTAQVGIFTDIITFTSFVTSYTRTPASQG